MYTIRTYPETVYPVEKWIYRIEKDYKPITGWKSGGYSKDASIEKAEKELGKKPHEIIVENGR